jgi:hypothetical protein
MKITVYAVKNELRIWDMTLFMQLIPTVSQRDLRTRETYSDISLLAHQDLHNWYV